MRALIRANRAVVIAVLLGLIAAGAAEAAAKPRNVLILQNRRASSIPLRAVQATARAMGSCVVAALVTGTFAARGGSCSRRHG